MDKALWLEKLKIYDELVAKVPGLERLGKTMPYTSANTYMFSLFNKAGEIGLRLSKEQQKEFIEKYDSGPYKSYGATMKDYVLVPESMLDDLDLLATYLQMSKDFVESLKPQPRKKK
ncbi:MAG: hypothetical protein ACRBF0_13585 [Calditrichia bacterium]